MLSGDQHQGWIMVRQLRHTSAKPTASPALPQPPRFIRHDDICGRGSKPRLFKRSDDPPTEGRLSAKGEVVLFKRMHYCGYRMSKMWDRLESLNQEERRDYLGWFEQYTRIRDRIVAANVGLVFSMLSKRRFTNVDFDELRSEGLMALLRSVDTFDPWRGFRFSTYACNSIYRAFSRLAKLEYRHHQVQPNSFEPQLEPDEWIEHQRQDYIGLLIERLTTILRGEDAALNDHERFVLEQRFPLQPDGKRATLRSVGKKMKFSKERVRQIQNSAVSKLRQALKDDPLVRG